MKIFTQICRVLLGTLFIFSGAVKLNDPFGFAYMLEDYFEVFAVDITPLFHHLVPYSIIFAVVICVFEIVLGLAILLQYRMGITMVIALLLTLFFTFLTFYTFYFDKVKECGCFGTVIRMSPLESFYKNLITLVFILFLFFRRNRVFPALSKEAGDNVIVVFTLICLAGGFYITEHLPFIDNLNYKVGNNIPKLMEPEEKPRYKWILEKDGQEFEFSDSNYPTDTNYKYKRHVLIGDSIKMIPQIVGFRIEGEEGDITPKAFEGNKLLIIIPFSTPAYENCSGKCMERINRIVRSIDASKKAEVMVLTSHSNATSFEEYRHNVQLAAPFYFVDETILKTMVRSNPGLMLLKNGTIKGKWHYNDVPHPKEIMDLLH